MSFGGGDAYLVFGQGLFVDTGMIPSDLYFEQVVTVSNAVMFWASNVKSCPLSLLIVIAIAISLLVCNVVLFAF